MENGKPERFEIFAVVEEWRPAIGFEGLYEVSSHGHVRRVGRAARSGAGRGGGVRLGRIRMPQPVPGGYLGVQLWKKRGAASAPAAAGEGA